jgi:hypothetical protein
MDRSAGDLARSTPDWPERAEGFQRPGRRGSAADEVVRGPNFGRVAVALTLLTTWTSLCPFTSLRLF